MRKAHIGTFASAIATAALFVFMAHPGSAQAAKVIHDSGLTVPSAQYLAQLFSLNQDDATEQPVGTKIVTFPITTASMAPGALAAPATLKQPVWLAQPVFFIGADDRSKAWLQSKRDELRRINAIGIVVQAASYEDFRKLQLLANGIPLAPASADGGLAQSLGVSAYPFLIRTDGSIAQ
ncbi:MAG TPA: integrating conjugative element protein [Noviherbaspirillum sp.]